MSIETLERAADKLAAERDLRSVHIGGGEPFLKPELLTKAVGVLRDRQIPISYVETNAFWADDVDKAVETFRPLKEAGLPGVLVSVSMFHNEYTPLSRAINCINAAHQVFGHYNVVVYMSHLLEIIGRMRKDRVHSLDEFCRMIGIDPKSGKLLNLYDIVPSGRAVEELRDYYKKHPAEAFAPMRCASELTDTSHFHIDCHGNLITGLCAGIAAGSVENLHPRKSTKTSPVFTTLCKEGPYGLALAAIKNHEFQFRVDGYVSKCDLCMDVRRCLSYTDEYPELQPSEFYR